MSHRGRPPVPNELKLIHGNPGHHPIPEAVAYAPGVPPKPNLSPGAEPIWERLVAEMQDVKGLLRQTDGRALWQLAEDEAMLEECTYGIWEQAAEIERQATIKAKHEGKPLSEVLPGGGLVALLGTSRGRMALSTINNLAARVIIERREFGLTPSSRPRISTHHGAEHEVDPVTSIFCAATPLAG